MGPARPPPAVIREDDAKYFHSNLENFSAFSFLSWKYLGLKPSDSFRTLFRINGGLKEPGRAITAAGIEGAAAAHRDTNADG